MKKAELIVGIVFIVSAFLALYEFIFIQGMFTWLMALALVAVTGLAAIVMALINKNYRLAITDLLFIIALTAGYMFTI